VIEVNFVKKFYVKVYRNRQVAQYQQRFVIKVIENDNTCGKFYLNCEQMIHFALKQAWFGSAATAIAGNLRI
jgi:hypothetical protein